MSDQLNVKDFMIGAAVGVALGAAIALLTAPKAGKEVREDIHKGITFVKDKSQQLVGGMKGQSNEVIGKLAEVKEKVQTKWTELKENETEGVTAIQMDEDQQDSDDGVYSL